MKASLQLRLSQHLALTPQLQQSIRLLQLSTLELQQEVAMAVAQNPLLESEDEWIASPLRVAGDGSVIAQAPNSAAPEPMSGSSAPSESGERADGDDGAGGDDYNGHSSSESGDSSQWNLDDYGRSSGASDDDDLPPLQIHESTTTLRDFLMAQLRVTQASLRDRALITFLIESLGDDGYLTASLDEIQADLPEELDVDLDELAAFRSIGDRNGPTADGAVLHVSLLLDGEVERDLDGLPAVRTGNRLVVQQLVGPVYCYGCSLCQLHGPARKPNASAGVRSRV
jgi:RNA polymerase sigma-54 factor